MRLLSVLEVSNPGRAGDISRLPRSAHVLYPALISSAARTPDLVAGTVYFAPDVQVAD